MKKSAITTLAILFFSTIFFSACIDDNSSVPPTSKPDGGSQSQESNPLVGTKWKLMRMEILNKDDDGIPEVVNYSSDNVIYEFQSEGKGDSEKINYHWFPQFKLVIHNNISSGFSNDIQEDGEYFCAYRQANDYLLPDDMHIDYNCNFFIIGEGDKYKSFWCTNGDNPHPDINATTDTILFSSGLPFYEADKHWVKYFVKIKDEVVK